MTFLWSISMPISAKMPQEQRHVRHFKYWIYFLDTDLSNAGCLSSEGTHCSCTVKPLCTDNLNAADQFTLQDRYCGYLFLELRKNYTTFTHCHITQYWDPLLFNGKLLGESTTKTRVLCKRYAIPWDAHNSGNTTWSLWQCIIGYNLNLDGEMSLI